MALQKQAIPVNFSQGLDTKSDPRQVQLGKFLVFENAIFSKQGLLQKRNGFNRLATLDSEVNTFLTTFKGNLTAIGTTLEALSGATNTWVNKGSIQPVQLDTQSLVRSNTNQSFADSAVSSNGLVCTVYTDDVPSGGSTTPVYKYVVSSLETGQNIVAPTTITSTGTVTYAPKVYALNNYFIIVFTCVISAANHLQYIAVSTANTTSVTAATDIASSGTPASTGTFDGFVTNNKLYLAWAGTGTTLKMAYLTNTLSQSNTISFASQAVTQISVTADTTNGIVYAAYMNTAATTLRILAVDSLLNTILSPTTITSSGARTNVAAVGTDGSCTVFVQNTATYSYGSSLRTDNISKYVVTQAGSVTTTSSLVRSVGLASKPFMDDAGTIYFLGIYSSPEQPTYFLINGSGGVVAKLAYSNGGGYYTTGIPGVTVIDNTAHIAYLIKDLLIPVNKSQDADSSSAVYTQTGVNLASFTMTPSQIVSSEIGNDLHITGGFLWMYDGYEPVEHGFHLYPDNVGVTTATGSGSITAQQYYYVATYEWADNQGNIFRSAGSIPVAITTTTASSTNTIKIPTLRLTYKTANPVKINLYRWSTAQQTYYSVASTSVPTLNDTSTDSVTFTDTQADSAIIGNSILYTTGGVVENIAAPAVDVTTLYKSRLFAIAAEDKNVLWYSKQVIQGTPVEMSDLFTLYVAPTAGAQGNTGPMRCLSALDDKLVIFKDNAIYYVVGNGPDNTGANNDFSEPTFITSTVGCANQHSIVFMPQGLMFQSDKGIWLLGRDLSTQYIGAPVESYTDGATVVSALNIPGTNQVRFTLDTGVTLMYDYYYGQWGTFANIPGISSTLYQDRHTFLNERGQVYQETPGSYQDGSQPVLMRFQMPWANLAGLQGYERAYFFYLLGTYLSPHKLYITIGYDYQEGPSQAVTITPDNYSAPYGGDSLYGGSPVNGGASAVEQWRVFFKQQKCQAFQITIREIFDATIGTGVPGAGFTLSGLNLVIGGKKGYRPQPNKNSAG